MEKTEEGYLPDGGNRAKRMIDLVRKGLAHHNLKDLGEAEEIGKDIDSRESELTALLAKKGSPLAVIPGHLERIGDNLESIINCVRTKINDGIMFSDRAVKEVDTLFKDTSELLWTLGDTIMTSNRVLLDHIMEKGKEMVDWANECATLHEERLVQGICMPKSAPIYLDILDSLKEISWHIRESARLITSIDDKIQGIRLTTETAEN